MSCRIKEEYNILVLYIKNELVGYWKLQKNKKERNRLQAKFEGNVIESGTERCLKNGRIKAEAHCN